MAEAVLASAGAAVLPASCAAEGLTRLRSHRPHAIVSDIGMPDRDGARRLLAESEHSVAEIARQLGYADPANFTRAFRKQTGTTPTAFRARTRQA